MKPSRTTEEDQEPTRPCESPGCYRQILARRVSWPCMVLAFSLTLSCATSLLERAHDPPGFSGGVGVEGFVQPVVSPSDELYSGSFSGLVPLANLRYSIPDGPSFSIRGGCGYYWLAENEPLHDASRLHPLLLDAQLAAKFRLGEHGAIRVGAGAMGFPTIPGEVHPLLELGLLHDFSDVITAQFSVAATTNSAEFFFPWPMAARLGFSYHPRLSRRLLGHVALTTGNLTSAGTALGLDITSPTDPTEEE